MNGNLQHFDYERELADATAAMELAFENWKCPELSVATRILWNPRFTSRAGDAMYAPCGCSRIRLSAPLWPHFPEVDRYETVIHEAAHIAAPYLVLKGDPGRRHPPRIGHGIEWKRLMWRAGLEAKRCHTLDIDKLGLRRRPM